MLLHFGYDESLVVPFLTWKKNACLGVISGGEI